MTESIAYKFENGESPKEFCELTDKKILAVAKKIKPLNGCTMEEAFICFAKAILKEAREK
jgi:hypothetical protein